MLDLWKDDPHVEVLPKGGIVHVDLQDRGRISINFDARGSFQVSFVGANGNRYDSLVYGDLQAQPEAWEKAPSDVLSHRNVLLEALTSLVCRLDALAASQANDLTNFKGKAPNIPGMPRMLKTHSPAIDCKCGVHKYGYGTTCTDVEAAIARARGLIKL